MSRHVLSEARIVRAQIMKAPRKLWEYNSACRSVVR